MILNQSEFNQNWNLKSLSELGTFSRGKSKHRPRNDPKLFENGTYPFIQTGDIKDANLFIEQHSECYSELGLQQSKIWEANTLCITIAANIAETALLRYPMCFPDSVVGFRAYENESSELFMHYVFTFIKRAIQSAASGSIQDNINIDFLTNLKFKVPDKPNQDKIASVLSTLDEKIALNNETNATLEQMAKTLYDYWFVQFDFPDDNGKPYKSSGGEMVYNDVLKREIPIGWEVQNLSHHLKCNEKKLGKNHSLPFINYLDTSSLTNNQLSEAIHLVVGKDEIPSRANMVISHNDILYSTVRPNQNHFGFIKNPLENFIASTGFAVLSHKNNPNLNSIFYLFLTSDKNNKKLIRISETATSAYPSISPKDILNLQIALPSDSKDLIKMAEVFDSNFSKISINQKENQELTKLRDWLLPMLMNGQVTVQ